MSRSKTASSKDPSAPIDRPKRSPRKKANRENNAARGASWTFPKESLESSIRIARAIDEKHGGNPMGAEDLAKAVGFRQSADWRFLDLLRAANQYALVQK